MFFHSVALFPASKKNLKETDYLERRQLSIFARLWQQYWDAVIDALALMYYLLCPPCIPLWMTLVGILIGFMHSALRSRWRLPSSKETKSWDITLCVITRDPPENRGAEPGTTIAAYLPLLVLLLSIFSSIVMIPRCHCAHISIHRRLCSIVIRLDLRSRYPQPDK